MKIYSIILLVVAAGLANGLMDHLAFHYAGRPAPSSYWNPKESWQNKYRHDDEGNLVRPLQPAFTGSTTVLAWTTDGWHLMKTLMMAAFRTALVLLAAQVWTWSRRRWMNRVAWAGAWIGLAAVQAIGFHITYSWIFKP